ncbi:MAG: hypothetical protein ACRYFV_06110 [Janthinobacterium lividum]
MKKKKHHKKKAQKAWRAAAVAGLAAGAYFLFKDNSRLFSQLKDRVQSLLSKVKPAQATLPIAAVPPIGRTTNVSATLRTPSLANGNVVDVIASNPPAPESGSNFTKHGEVHGPQH